MNQILIDCYCAHRSMFQDTFTCSVCEKNSHLKCYFVSFTEKVPQNMRCINCRLQQYDPYLQLKENLYGKQFYILNPNINYMKQEISFDLHKFDHFRQNSQLDIVVVCATIRPQLKQPVVQPGQTLLIPKKRFPPQYEWPSMNINLEWNNIHVPYKLHEFATIKRDKVKPHNVLRFSVTDLKHHSFITAFVVERVRQQEIVKRIFQRHLHDETIVPQLKQKYHSLIDQLMADDQIAIQSAFISLSLTDPVSSSQMIIPAKGKFCDHIDNFDLILFLENNSMPKENRWKCPRCQQFIDVDQIRIDYILYMIINHLKNTQPIDYLYVQKVNILDKDLNFSVESTKVQSNPQFTLKVSQIKQALPYLSRLMDEIYGETTEVCEISRKDVVSLIETLKSISSFYSQPLDLFTTGNLIDVFFDTYPFLNEEDEVNGSIEQICRHFYHKSFAGVYVDFMSHFLPNAEQFVKATMAFFSYTQVEFKKHLSIIQAYTFYLRTNENLYPEFQYRSFGYVFGYVLRRLLKLLELKESQVYGFISSKCFLKSFMKPDIADQSGFFNLSEFLIQLFDFRRREVIKDVISKIWGPVIDDDKKIFVMQLMYFMIVNLRKEKNPHSPPPFAMSPVTIDQQCNEMFDWKDMKGYLKKCKITPSDFRTAYQMLDYDYIEQEERVHL